ncbi:hypothetical protein WH8501_02515 [Crocosphaera watsonii WH 8501]|uniref:Uncharacterized protein n=6 Tax=Crocosphaera TaxID=263510 RepID=Q4C6Q0_CROWT|nr:hypothetical protein [Crocosphaera watsonii]EAM51918.1 hypothetical protein CwatDRAFT_5119 [Crocosphaera watsonii WH 8501]
MKGFLVGIISIVALVSVAKITPAEPIKQTSGQTNSNPENIARQSPYEVGTITGVVSGAYGSIIFVELSDQTKLKFHHPSGSLARGERVLVYQKDGEHFLIEASNPRRPNFSQNLRSPNTEALQEVGLNRAIADFPNQQSVVRF